MKRKKSPFPEMHENKNDAEKSEGKLSSVHLEDSHPSFEYWAARVTEARATMARALNINNTMQKEGPASPTYITDPIHLLEYWAARSGEARARMEERFALASLSINMDKALKESNDMLRRLEAALDYSPQAKDSLMNGLLF